MTRVCSRVLNNEYIWEYRIILKNGKIFFQPISFTLNFPLKYPLLIGYPPLIMYPGKKNEILEMVWACNNVPGYFNVEIRALFFLNLIMEIIKSTKNTTPVIMAMAANTSRTFDVEWSIQ